VGRVIVDKMHGVTARRGGAATKRISLAGPFSWASLVALFFIVSDPTRQAGSNEARDASTQQHRQRRKR